VLEYRLQGSRLSYRWTNVVRGFVMAIKITTAPGVYAWIRPTEQWKVTTVRLSRPEDFRVDQNFYVLAKDVLKPAPDSTSARTGLSPAPSRVGSRAD
jgi:hypothetical protein